MAQRKSLSWILEFTSKLPEAEQIKCLQANDTPAMRIILQYCFHEAAKWALPEGTPPYKVTELNDLDSILYGESRKLYLFLEGGNTNLTPLRRERLFVDLLESVTPGDAKLLISIKDKKLPYPGLTPETIKKAYPGIF